MTDLTAEQVREAIFNGSSYASYDGVKYYADGINMQTIADELNTRAERTCKMEYSGGVPDFLSLDTWTCTECGSPIYNDCEPSYCEYCGSKVVEQ